MPETDLKETKKETIRSCTKTVGSEPCIRCVKENSCPSGFTELEEIQEAESRNCCKGQA